MKTTSGSPTRFRTLLFLAILPILVGIAVTTVLLSSAVIGRSARVDLERDLARTRRVFDDAQTSRTALFDAQGRVIAEEPRLKAVAATERLDRDTVVGVGREIHKLLGSDLFRLTDRMGRVTVDASADGPGTGDLGREPLVVTALGTGHASGIIVEKSQVHQVVAHRLEFGSRTVGVLVTGYRIDDRVVARIGEQTGSAIAVVLDGEVVAVWPPEQRSTFQALSARAQPSPPLPTETTIGGRRIMALAVPFPAYAGPRRLQYIVARSLDDAMAPTRRLAALLVGVMGLALAIAVVISLRIARRLSSPLEALAALAARIGTGDLGARAAIRGPREILELAAAMGRMTTELGHSREAFAAKERLEKELEIAARIQLSLLPKRLDRIGLDLATAMIPASEVGGDYFDVLPEIDGDGTWIAVGDVAGHGLTAGLVMLMVQSALASAVRSQRNATPGQLLVAVNAVVYENVRHRLGQNEHVTMTVLHHRPSGRVTFAGAHEDILILRAATGLCDQIRTPGPWIGIMPAIDKVVTDSQFDLQEGDLMILYSDGVSEARNASLGYYGLERLQAVVERLRDRSVEEIKEAVISEVRAFAPIQEDDITLVVLRHGAGR